MRQGWDYELRFYYHDEVAAPKTPRDLAIATVHKGVVSRDMEIAAGKSRGDIGRIEMRDLRPFQDQSRWQLVWMRNPASTRGVK